MPSKELNILIIACRLYLDTSKIEDWRVVADDTSLDWKRAFDLAAWHNIRPIFFEALRQYKPDTVPSELLQNLTSFCRQLTVGTLSKLVQLKELTENFERENIQLVLHKGIHYASFYKSLGHREFGDIDVLIMEKDLEKATELMQKTGYKLYHDYDSLKNITKIDYHLIFDSKNATSPVEIHWKPNILSSFTAFDSLQIQKINSVYFPVPSSEDTLTLMSLHHGQKENWDKLKYLLDLQLASSNNRYQFSPELNKGFDLLELFNSNLKNKETVTNWILQAESINSIESTKANAEKDLATWPQKIKRWGYKFQLLSAETQLNLFKAAIIIAVIKIGLKVLPYPTFKKLYDRSIQSDFQEEYPQTKLSKAAWAIRVVSVRWPWNATCLPQALSFKYFFRKDPSLHLKIGVNKTNQGIFQAHAWVEKEGKVLIGETPETFVPLWEWNQ